MQSVTRKQMVNGRTPVDVRTHIATKRIHIFTIPPLHYAACHNLSHFIRIK